jgi:hypothetical protein
LKRFLIIVLLLLLLAAGGLYFYAYRQPTPAADMLLPESTLLLLETPDFPRAHAAFRETAIYALWQEPSFQNCLAAPLRRIDEALGRPADAPGSLSDTIFPFLRGETFIALTHFTGMDNLHAGLVLGADLKNKLLETKAALAYRELTIRTLSTNTVVTAKTHHGHKYKLWQLSPSFQACYTFFGSMFVITFDEEILRDIITRSTGKETEDFPSLAENPAYKATRNQWPTNRHTVIYCNAGQVLAPLSALAQQRAGPLAAFRRIESTSTSMTFTSGLIHDLGFTVYNKPETNLPQLTSQLVTFIAPQTSACIADTADCALLYRNILDLAGQFAQTPAGNAVLRFQKAINALGIEMDREILNSLGPEIALLSTWREGTRYPDVALVLQCKDRPTFLDKLDIVFAALKDNALGTDEDYPWENTEYLGVRLRTARIGSSLAAPTYFLDGGHLVIAANPDYARELLSQSRTPFSLAPLPLPLPASNATELVYCDLRAVAPPLYDLWRSQLTNTTFAVTNLPPSDILARHLGVYISETQTTPTNETTITYSPLGKPLTWMISLAGAYVWVKPWLDQHITIINPAVPTTSSNTASPPLPPGNQKAESQTPSPQ